MEKTPTCFGGVLLLAGSCIGAGMLALPVTTAPGGFFPTLFLFVLAWVFMLSTGLLLLEANLKLGGHISLISLADRTLGKLGKGLCWGLFLFLFYSLGVAYIAASGSILSSFCLEGLGGRLSPWVGSLGFTFLFGVFVYVGTQLVDYFNRVLMLGLFLSYLALLYFGLPHVNSSYLTHQNWPLSFSALPVLVISFGFHNMIPSLVDYYQGDRKKLLLVICGGSALPLVVYLLWQITLLGIIPLHGEDGLLAALNQGETVTSVLAAIVGCSSINLWAQLFALSAVITSFLAQSLSLVDFLADGLQIEKKGKGRINLIMISLAPPFLFAFLKPDIFITALNWAGGFAAVILFGCLPALMVWKLRSNREQKLVPIGKGGLILIFVGALFIFCVQCASSFGFFERLSLEGM